MFIDTYSPWHFTDKKDIPFNKELYSKFKYGSKDAARVMGKMLGQSFTGFLDKKVDNLRSYEEISIAKIMRSISKKQIVIIPSPYNFTPTATFALKDYFISELNPWLIEKELAPVQEAKIFRTTSYLIDYAKMSIADRKFAIGSESFHLDSEFLRNKFVIFLDDIRITGSHEERIKEMIEREKLDSKSCHYMFMYYAQLECKECAPDIEDYLNFYSVKNILDINRIIRNEGFLFNTRVVKYILASDTNLCKGFLQYQSDDFLHTLYHYAIGNCYHKSVEFSENFQFLKGLIDSSVHL